MCSQLISKYQIADILNIDIKTLANYCNKRYYEELKKLDYDKHQKKFTPAQVQFLKQKLGF